MTERLAPNFFDRLPVDCITAERVRVIVERERSHCIRFDEEDHELRQCGCDKIIYHITLRGLLAHPGVSSSACAVIEEVLR